MNYKRHKQHGSSTCGLCKWGKKYGVPRKDKKFFLKEQNRKEENYD